MNAKEYLSQAFRRDQRINSKLEQLASLREISKRGTASIHAKRTCGTTHSQMEDSVVKLIDLQHELNEDIDRFVDLKREIRTAINELHQPEYQLVLELRYLLYKRWDEIAKIMNFSVERTYCIHGKALMAVNLPRSLVVARNEGTAT